MDRTTPGLDPETRKQLIDLDQDTLIKALQDDDKKDDEKVAILIKILDSLNKRVGDLEKKPAVAPDELTKLEKKLRKDLTPSEKTWLDKVLGR